MNLAYNVAQVMHRIRVKLYPIYLPGQEGTFIARIDSEASLSIEQVCAALRELAKSIEVINDGESDAAGYIDSFLDNEENSLNAWYLPGNQFVLNGHKIKIAGDDPGIGMYFVDITNSANVVKVTRIVENNPSRIISIIPIADYEKCRIEIRTQFSGSGSNILKNVRVIKSDFAVERA